MKVRLLAPILFAVSLGAAVVPGGPASAAGLQAGLYKELNPGPSGSNPQYILPAGNRFITFAANAEGQEPWAFNDTSARQLGNIGPGPASVEADSTRGS